MIKLKGLIESDGQSRKALVALTLGVLTGWLVAPAPAHAQSLTEFPTADVMQYLGAANEIGAILTRRLADPAAKTIMRSAANILGPAGTIVEGTGKDLSAEHQVLRFAAVEGTSSAVGLAAGALALRCGVAATHCMVGAVGLKTVTGQVVGNWFDKDPDRAGAMVYRGVAAAQPVVAPLALKRSNELLQSSSYAARERAAVEQQRQEEARRQREAERRYAQEQQLLLEQQRQAHATLMNGFAQGMAQAIAGGLAQGALNSGSMTPLCCDGYAGTEMIEAPNSRTHCDPSDSACVDLAPIQMSPDW